MKRIFLPFLVVISLSFQNVLSQSVGTDNSFIAKRIILIGDAGEPSMKEKEPVLAALEQMASEIKDSTVVVFLGDNIYPIGLTDEFDPNRKEYERRIDEQINSILKTNAKGFFIPGNHDWNRGKKDGMDYIIRQYEYVREKGKQRVGFKPERGCPGPEYFDFGNDLRIIFIDTQWWLQNTNYRSPETDDCNFKNEKDILDELSLLIADDTRFIVLCGHHPLKTFGRHGGKYSINTHLFPLTELNNNLYLPLPVIGSLFVLLKNMGISVQDVSNQAYKKMVRSIESVIKNRAGIVYASGHDHALQAIRGITNNLYLVSGAGIYDLVDDYVGKGNETIYADNVPGFFMLDFLSDGRIRLSAVKVIDRQGSTAITFEMFTK